MNVNRGKGGGKERGVGVGELGGERESFRFVVLLGEAECLFFVGVVLSTFFFLLVFFVIKK